MKWIGLVAVAVATSGCLDPELDVGSRTQAVVGGTISPQDQATVALVTGTTAYCSGVLIGPTRVLTAAHCVPPNVDYPLEDIEVFFGVDLTQGGTRIAIASARAYPGWTSHDLTGDLGVIELAEPSAIAPVEVAPDVLEVVAPGDSVRAVGYGITQPGGDDPGVKRSGSMVADMIEDSTIRLAANGVVTCSGDSGGPLFASRPEGEVLVGVHTRSNCDTTALAERVDVHADFIAGLDPVDAAGGPPLDADLIGGCQSSPGGGPGLPALIVLVALGLARRRD